MRDKIDQYVLGVIRARLAQPDLKNLLVNTTTDRSAKSRPASPTPRPKSPATSMTTSTISSRDPCTAQSPTSGRPLFPTHSGYGVSAADDPVAAFDAIKDVGQIATIIDFFCTVTLHPHQRGMRTTPEDLARDVTIEWKV